MQTLEFYGSCGIIQVFSPGCPGQKERMTVENRTTMEDTLFLPVMGRIYASENFPNILTDEAAVKLKSKLPDHLKNQKLQNQYGALTGAVRSAAFDRYIKDFLRRHPEGVIAQLGCGLETTYQRCDNGTATWYEVDFPDTIRLRQSVLRDQLREHYFPGNPFALDWLKEIRQKDQKVPVLVTAGGLLHYFEQEKILNLLKKIQAYGHIEILFDAMNEEGIRRMAGYMQQPGTEKKEKAAETDYFHVDHSAALAKQLHAKVMLDELYFSQVDLGKLGFLARSAMKKSDKHRLMKIIALKL